MFNNRNPDFHFRNICMVGIGFIFKDRKLTLDPETLTVSAFNDIWEADKDKSKAKASNMLSYVFHMRDITQRNPFRDLSDSHRESLAKRNSFGDENYKFSPKDQEMIDRAMAWYDVLNKNSIFRLSMTFDRKIDQINDYLEKNVIDSSEDMENQMKDMEKIEKILNSKKRTDDFVRQEQEKSKIKGKETLSPNQAGLLNKKGKQ